MMLRSGVKPKDDKKTHNSSASKVPLPRKTWGKNMGKHITRSLINGLLEHGTISVAGF